MDFEAGFPAFRQETLQQSRDLIKFSLGVYAGSIHERYHDPIGADQTASFH